MVVWHVIVLSHTRDQSSEVENVVQQTLHKNIKAVRRVLVQGGEKG